MPRKYGHGGWWNEHERHKMARLGYKTGTKLNPKRNFPPYLDAIAHVPMVIGVSTGSRKFDGTVANPYTFAGKLKAQGWNLRREPHSMNLGIEAWRGKNYILISPAYGGKKVKIDEIFIFDKDVGERLGTIFKKEKEPIPVKKKKKKFIFFAKKSKSISIADLDKRQDLQLVTDSQDVEAIKEYIGKDAEDYDSFFVKVEDGDYKEIYGFEGNVPYLNKSVWKVR